MAVTLIRRFPSRNLPPGRPRATIPIIYPPVLDREVTMPGKQDDLWQQAARWLDEGAPLAMATIVRIVRSSSQPLGARMIMTSQDRFVGEVSGGCVEGDVYRAAGHTLRDGTASMLHYTRVDDPLVEVGLNCDGEIDVLLEPLDRALYDLLTGEGERVNVTLCAPAQPRHPRPVHAQMFADGRVIGADLPPGVVEAALDALRGDRPVSVTDPSGRVALLEPVVPPPTLLIFGASDRAVPLVRLAKLLGFRTVVSDARGAFADPARHPDADAVIVAWPGDVIAQEGADHRTFVVSLNHEPRFEDALLDALVGRDVAYIGMIGKRTRQAERLERARQSGLDLGQLPPIHTPIGLDLGGKSSEEIALSILAEIVAVRNGRSGGMMVDRHRAAEGPSS
jgi:xanthine dehydrogenase accessory factor